MILALVLAAAVPSTTAIDAERAFAERAKSVGQWTAFREYAEASAVMFNPQAVWAHDFLDGRKDPPRSIEWWPARSFVSCDGGLAVTAVGRFQKLRHVGHGSSFRCAWRVAVAFLTSSAFFSRYSASEEHPITANALTPGRACR